MKAKKQKVTQKLWVDADTHKKVKLSATLFDMNMQTFTKYMVDKFIEDNDIKIKNN